MDFALSKISRSDVVLDLGCGYGRLIPQLAKKAKFGHGIDTSVQYLLFGQKYLKNVHHFWLQHMNALKLTFSANTMDVVLCLQNGISAFQVDQRALIKEAVRVTKPGGIALFTSYTEKFSEHRLKWFNLQLKAGLVKETNTEKTGNSRPVCKEDFYPSALGPKKFLQHVRWIRGIHVTIKEVDDSCVFFMVRKEK